MIKRSFVFAIALFTLSCSSKDKERKIALETTETTNTQKSNTVKTTSALELDSQFKGCKAHW